MCEQCGCSEVNEANTDQTLEEKIKDTIESIRGALQSHGGDVELIGIDDDNTVKTAVTGICRRRSAGITGGRTDNSLTAFFNRFSHRHHHAPVFKGTGGMAAFQFKIKLTATVSLRQFIGLDERGITLPDSK